MRYLVPGPLPCPEVVAAFYIRPAEVPTLFSVKGDAQVEQQNTVVGFLTPRVEYSTALRHRCVQPSGLGDRGRSGVTVGRGREKVGTGR